MKEHRAIPATRQAETYALFGFGDRVLLDHRGLRGVAYAPVEPNERQIRAFYCGAPQG